LKESVLFIVNKIYLDPGKNEGGVKNCTEDYISLLSTRFNVIPFPVAYANSLFYRLRVKLGFNNYNDYAPKNYKNALKKIIINNHIKYVFLNLSNTMTFALILKEEFNSNVKVILCSHGNESGDLLHHCFRFEKGQNKLTRLKNSFLFAKTIEKEVKFRLRFLDMVLTVSEVEEGVEKWLGSKRVFIVPRIVKSETTLWNPVDGRIGFLGDLSHAPNHDGIVSFCDALSLLDHHKIKLRLMGNPENIGHALAQKYSFVEYCGFVPNERIHEEVGTWAIFLNLVFYYSRGVSTKLAKGLGWGIPVLTTPYGNRGYDFPHDMLTSAETPSQMAQLTVKLIADSTELEKMRNNSIYLTSHFHDYTPIMNKLYPLLTCL
jgi:hypothetical protein